MQFLQTILVILALSASSIQAETILQHEVTVRIECKAELDGTEFTINASGVVVSAEGHVLTAKHLYEGFGPDNVQCIGKVSTREGQIEEDLVFQEADAQRDAALYQFHQLSVGRTFKHAKWCDLKGYHRYQMLDSVGFPASQRLASFSVRQGVLSTNFPGKDDLLQTDVMTAPGMSGGGAFLSGTSKLLGIVIGEKANRQATTDFYGILPISKITNDLREKFVKGDDDECGPIRHQRELSESLAEKSAILTSMEPKVDALHGMKPSLESLIALNSDLSALVANREKLEQLVEILPQLEELLALKSKLQRLDPNIDKLVALVEEHEQGTIGAFAPYIKDLPAVMQEANPRENLKKVSRNDNRLKFIETQLSWEPEVSEDEIHVTYEMLNESSDVSIAEIEVILRVRFLGAKSDWVEQETLNDEDKEPIGNNRERKFTLTEGSLKGLLSKAKRELRDARKKIKDDPDSVYLDPVAKVQVLFKFDGEEPENPKRFAETTLQIAEIETLNKTVELGN